jgi:hypothetical protein
MSIFIDTAALTYPVFWIPGDSETDPEKPRDGSVPADCSDLSPGTYGFGQNAAADFTFDVTAAETFDYPPEFDGFLSGRGTNTLIVEGYSIAFDATSLDQDLLLLGQTEELTRATTHQLVLVPASYGFICSSALVASLTFVLDVAGVLSIPPEDAGFATVNNDPRALTIAGYAVTFDGTLLTQDLSPLILRGDTQAELSRDTVHTLTLIPAEGYGMIVGGIPGNFVYQVNTDGTVSFPAIYAGFLAATGATLVLRGYPVVLDTSTPDIPLAEAPITRWFGLQVLTPAIWPIVTVDDTVYVFTLELDGSVSVDPTDPHSYKITTAPRLGLGG